MLPVLRAAVELYAPPLSDGLSNSNLLTSLSPLLGLSAKYPIVPSASSTVAGVFHTFTSSHYFPICKKLGTFSTFLTFLLSWELLFQDPSCGLPSYFSLPVAALLSPPRQRACPFSDLINAFMRELQTPIFKLLPLLIFPTSIKLVPIWVEGSSLQFTMSKMKLEISRLDPLNKPPIYFCDFIIPSVSQARNPVFYFSKKYL